MEPNPVAHIRKAIDHVYQTESRRIFASLVRSLKNFDLAEEALHEAFAVATEVWPREGVPENPRSWLISTGRFKAIDALRRSGRLKELQPEIAARLDSVAEHNQSRADEDIKDDQLRLIFTCCHPAIDPVVQVPLTLREVCGLTTEEIARAFLVSKSTMAQRIVRGKTKIQDAGIPFVVPSLDDLPDRLEGVLSVIYLVFNEGYSASNGDSLTRVDLSSEAIRLARLLQELLPEPEVLGLLALMLLHDSRREARTTATGEIILLEDQDRKRWDREKINEGLQLIESVLQSGRFGVYTIQAAISATHANAATAEETDWDQIVGLYSALLQFGPSSIVELNRAVAVAMRDGPEAGIQIINAILERGELADYHLAHSARAELLRRANRSDEALAGFKSALELAKQETERDFLLRRIAELSQE